MLNSWSHSLTNLTKRAEFYTELEKIPVNDMASKINNNGLTDYTYKINELYEVFHLSLKN